MASGSGKAKASSWAAAMGTVEALKDHRHAGGGVARWSLALRDVQERASSAAAGSGKGKPLHHAAGGAAAARRKVMQEEEEEELRTVMYLSNWGPNN